MPPRYDAQAQNNSPSLSSNTTPRSSLRVGAWPASECTERRSPSNRRTAGLRNITITIRLVHSNTTPCCSSRWPAGHVSAADLPLARPRERRCGPWEGARRDRRRVAAERAVDVASYGWRPGDALPPHRHDRQPVRRSAHAPQTHRDGLAGQSPPAARCNRLIIVAHRGLREWPSTCSTRTTSLHPNRGGSPPTTMSLAPAAAEHHHRR